MIAALLGLSVAVSACGGSGSDSTKTAAAAPASKSAATETTAAKAPTGTPIVVATMAPIDTPVASLPQVFAGVKAAARAINAAGGINGHPIKVTTCNNALDPNQEVACANNIVKGGAVATVGTSFSTNGDGVLKVFHNAGVASLASSANIPAAYESPVAFPIDVFATTGTPCVTKATSATNATQVVLDLPSIRNIADITASVAAKQNFPLKKPIGFPPTTSDYAPLAQRVASSGSSYAIFNGSGSQTVGFLQAAASLGQKLKVCVNDNLTAGPLAKIGPAAGDLYAGTSFPPVSTAGSIPLMKTFTDQMKAEESSGDKAASLSLDNYNTLMLRSWLGMQAFQQIAKGISGDVTPASFLKALKTAKVSFPGVLPDIDFSKPQKVGVYTRVFNGTSNLQKWNVDKKQWDLVPNGKVDIVTDATPQGALAGATS